MDLYGYLSYRAFLREVISHFPAGGHGVKSKIARKIGCQMAYVSQVFKERAHFSLEQALGVARFLELSDQETDYFFLLVQFERAATPELRRYFREQLDVRRKKISARIRDSKEVPLSYQKEYYSTWLCSAVHVAISIEGLDRPRALSEHFGLSSEKIDKILRILTRAGLVKKSGDRFKLCSKNLHLDKSSPFTIPYHMSWRLRSILDIESRSKKSLRYTTVLALSKKEVEWVELQILALLEKINKRTLSSEAEQLRTLCIDWFNPVI